jgi:hypothetical protein
MAALAGFGLTNNEMKRWLVWTIESALDAGDVTQAEALLETIQGAMPSEVTPYLRAHAARLAARVAAICGVADSVETGFVAARQGFQRLGAPFDLAVTLLEHAEWLLAQGRPGDAAPLLEEARPIFERLRATPWLERLDRVSGMQDVPA